MTRAEAQGRKHHKQEEEQMEASSAINAPHPDDGKGDEDAFFDVGGPDAADAPADADQVEVEIPKPVQTPPPGPSDPEAEGAEYAKTHGAADPTPPAASAGQTEDTTGKSEEDKKRGATEREYLVFQEIALTERALEHLLKQVKGGGEPRVALFELHSTVQRNDKAAAADAYSIHREALGQECDLAAVSSRSFKRRKVRPRQVVQAADVQIT